MSDAHDSDNPLSGRKGGRGGGGAVHMDPRVTRLNDWLLASFAGLLIVIGTVALKMLWDVSSKQADQASDIRMILFRQENRDRDVDGLIAKVEALTNTVNEIQRRQTGASNGR